MIKPILAGNQKYPLIAAPERLETLLIQIEITANAKISGREFHLRVRIQPVNRMRKVEEQAGEIVRLKFANDLIVGSAELLYRGCYPGRRKLIFDQLQSAVTRKKKNNHQGRTAADNRQKSALAAQNR